MTNGSVKVMEGIRILEVADHTFVPAASAILADQGAEVIKVEHAVRGDAMRGLGSTGVMDLSKGVHVILEHSNRGKKSIGIDLQTEEGLAVLHRLIATCDVFLVNKPPAVCERLKITLEQVRAHNPNIIYAIGTAHGTRGPDADKGGYDMTAYWCRSGNASAAMPYGSNDMTIQPAPAYGDSLGAAVIAGGIASALLHRERTGEVTEVEVSLLGTGIWSMSAAIALGQQLNMAWKQFPPGGVLPNPLMGFFLTKDDRHLNLTMLQANKYWAESCEKFGIPELADDPKYQGEKLAENSKEAHAALEEAIKQKTLDEWIDHLQDYTGQWAPVRDTLEVVDDPQVVAMDYIMEAETKDGTPFKLTTAPVQFGGAASPPNRAPEFNEHGDEILEALGLSMDEIIDLKIKGAIT